MSSHRLACTVGSINWSAVLFSEGSRAADMIGMFVRQKQGADILRFALDMFKAFFQNTRADTNIDQDACLAAFDIDGIAFTTTGKYGKFENDSDLSGITTW